MDVLTQQGMAATESVTAKDGTRRHKITAVIGPDGIGVENLRGSGKIAVRSCCLSHGDLLGFVVM